MLNIYKLMLDKGITISSVARKSGFNYFKLRNRLLGNVKFTTDDAVHLNKTCFNEYEFEWLFANNNLQKTKKGEK